MARRAARTAAPHRTVDPLREGRTGAGGLAEAALQVVAGARTPRGSRSGRVGPSSQLEDFTAADAEVDDLLRPAPERVLLLHGHALHFVAMPPDHHVLVLGPGFHAVARGELFP